MVALDFKVHFCFFIIPWLIKCAISISGKRKGYTIAIYEDNATAFRGAVCFNNNDEYNYLINSCLEIVSHFTRMAPGCIAEKGKHRSGAGKTCNSGVSVIVDNAFADVLANSCIG